MIRGHVDMHRLASFRGGIIHREGHDAQVIDPHVFVGSAGAGTKREAGIGERQREAGGHIVDDAHALEVNVQLAIRRQGDVDWNEGAKGVEGHILHPRGIRDERSARSATAFAFTREGLIGDDTAADLDVHIRGSMEVIVTEASVIPSVEADHETARGRRAFFRSLREGDGHTDVSNGDAPAIRPADGAAAGAAADQDVHVHGEGVNRSHQSRRDEAAGLAVESIGHVQHTIGRPVGVATDGGAGGQAAVEVPAVANRRAGDGVMADDAEHIGHALGTCVFHDGGKCIGVADNLRRGVRLGDGERRFPGDGGGTWNVDAHRERRAIVRQHRIDAVAGTIGSRDRDAVTPPLVVDARARTGGRAPRSDHAEVDARITTTLGEDYPADFPLRAGVFRVGVICSEELHTDGIASAERAQGGYAGDQRARIVAA